MPGKGVASMIIHPRHTQQDLRFFKVVDDGFSDFICDICFHISRGPRYNCRIVKFNVDLACASSEETSSAEDISHLVCKSGESCGNMDSKALLENITEQKAEQQSEFPAPQVRPIVALIVILFSMNLVLDYQKRYNVHFIRYTNWRLHKAEISLFNAIFVVVFFAQVTLAIVKMIKETIIVTYVKKKEMVKITSTAARNAVAYLLLILNVCFRRNFIALGVSVRKTNLRGADSVKACVRTKVTTWQKHRGTRP
ncbi:hypothetical protein POUND7_000483 [Theobroma cacao]